MNGDYFDTLTASSEASRRRRPVPRRRDVAERLAQLPMAQPEQAITQLTTMLDEHRADIWPRGERLHLLQDVAPAVRTMETSVQAQIGNASHPLPTAKARLVGAMVTLLQRLGDAFALAACDFCSARDKLPLLGRARLVAGVNQALRFDQAAFSLACQLGRTVPEGLWQHQHAVYGIAAQWDAHKRPWRDPSSARETCVRDRYVESLLLALSGPYAYQQREWPAIVAASAALAPLAELRDDPEAISVAIDGPDSGPAHATAGFQQANSCAWSLDLAAALAALDDAISASADETVVLAAAHGADARLPRGLAARLQHACHGSVERGYRRLPGTHLLATLPGLHALHRALAHGQDFDTYVQRLAGAGIEVGAHANAAAWMSGRASDAATPMLEARVLDQSVAGYRLAWSSAHGLRVKVGEVIGLAPGYDDAAGSAPILWLVGVVRWLRSDPDTGVTAGVSVLARDARAAAVGIVDANGQRGRQQRTLLMRDDDGHDSLLLARLAERDVRVLDLSCDDDSGRGWPLLHAVRCDVEGVDALSGACDRVSLADVPIPPDDAS